MVPPTVVVLFAAFDGFLVLGFVTERCFAFIGENVIPAWYCNSPPRRSNVGICIILLSTSGGPQKNSFWDSLGSNGSAKTKIAV